MGFKIDISCSALVINFFSMGNRNYLYFLLVVINYIKNTIITDSNSISFSTMKFFHPMRTRIIAE